jgi:hypothetical protein
LFAQNFGEIIKLYKLGCIYYFFANNILHLYDKDT